MKVSPCAGKPAESSILVNVPRLVTAYYKIYAESFRGADHLRRILEEVQAIVSNALAATPQQPEVRYLRQSRRLESQEPLKAVGLWNTFYHGQYTNSSASPDTWDLFGACTTDPAWVHCVLNDEIVFVCPRVSPSILVSLKNSVSAIHGLQNITPANVKRWESPRQSRGFTLRQLRPKQILRKIHE
jgi:hypothetical protein